MEHFSLIGLLGGAQQAADNIAAPHSVPGPPRGPRSEPGDSLAAAMNVAAMQRVKGKGRGSVSAPNPAGARNSDQSMVPAAEVARHMNCSREYCRQVVQRALRKLRKTGIQSGSVESTL